MAVPAEIRSVERPANTVVVDNGRDGPKRYAVRGREGVEYVPGGNPRPVNGPVIGHIIGGRFVPLREKAGSEGPDCLSYGAVAFAMSCVGDLLDDLYGVYEASDAQSIACIALLRVAKPGVRNCKIGTHYRRTFASVFFPGLALSKDSVGRLLERIGQDGAKREGFFARRAARSAGHLIAVDGTLKQDTSVVNDLSNFSYKGRVRGEMEYSLIYAYDVELGEPVAFGVFPGNSTDAASFSAFIRQSGLERGIIVADKGFPVSALDEDVRALKGLHFITPLRRGSAKSAKAFSGMAAQGVVRGIEARVAYKKAPSGDGKWLYWFRDASKAAAEESAFLERAKHSEGGFDEGEYASKAAEFGTIVLESDEDMDPKMAYLAYDRRWLLELAFGTHKGCDGLDQCNVQGDFSVVGSEFVNLVATTVTCRMIKRMGDAGLLDRESYGDVLDDLQSAWRLASAGKGHPKSGDGKWVHALGPAMEKLEKLGLSEPVAKPAPAKRGRPPKPKPEAESKPKRKRGRPRKNPQNPTE
jgi:hypothetical protein